MDYFNFKNGSLFAEDLEVKALSEQYGTPLYIYSKATLERHYHSFERALSRIPHLVCYSVKSNSNLALIHLMAKLGSGFDIVSEGELRRVIAAGGDPAKTVFSGVGKTDAELEFALKSGIRCLNVESSEELDAVSRVASRLGVKAPVALRINPDVDARTLPAISTGLKNNKFGICTDEAYELYLKMAQDPNLHVAGIDCHIGSQMTSCVPILEAADKIIAFYKRLQAAGIYVDHIDLGGGLGVTYDDELPPSPDDFFDGICERFKNLDCALYIEPGRAMVANAGILACKVVYKKHNGDKQFLVTDGAMNDLIRPALYNAHMTIVNATEHADEDEVKYDVVGPICESDDFLGKDRMLKARVGDVLAVRGAGAYGSSMSSNYNSRRLAAEILVDGATSYVVRKRQSFEQMMELELIVD